MSEKQQEQPWSKLGEKLKNIRQKMHESVAEVSGAVEIDEQALQRIEQGRERPAEDILMLLINHFGMHEDEAAGLWKLAGYDPPSVEGRDRDRDQGGDEPVNNRSAVLVMAVDPRIIYSDGVQVTASQNGVVISFSQASGTPNILTTAKVGMSREQAHAVIRTLQDALSRSEPRQLSEKNPQKAPKSDADKKES